MEHGKALEGTKAKSISLAVIILFCMIAVCLSIQESIKQH